MALTVQGQELRSNLAERVEHAPSRALDGSRHLLAGLLALLVIIAAAFAANDWFESIETYYIHGIAPWMFDQKNQGIAFQRVAFRQPDLLPIYGSSELDFDDPYDARRFFLDYPTGFNTFAVGMSDTEPLIMLQKFAALGADVRGKQVVISLSPSFFYQAEYHPETYRGNYSALHANAVVFNSQLSYGLRQRVARRMLDYWETLKKDPFLRFAVENLAADSPQSQLLYDAMLPLGQLHLALLEFQDHFESLRILETHKADILTELHPQPRRIYWTRAAARAEGEYMLKSTNNSFGMEDGRYDKFAKEIASNKNYWTDQRFLAKVASSEGYVDLELLLQTMQELGVRPLVILIPMNGYYWDYQGTTLAAREVLYARVREQVQAHGFPFVVFEDHDEDKYFLIDPGAHLSSKGWVYYNQVLDAFYNGKLK